MEILIMCDQKDCIHNLAHEVHHDHNTDKCTHYNPQIHVNTMKGGQGIVCLSKERDMTDPNKMVLKDCTDYIEHICGDCRLPAESCMKCCHRNK